MSGWDVHCDTHCVRCGEGIDKDRQCTASGGTVVTAGWVDPWPSDEIDLSLCADGVVYQDEYYYEPCAVAEFASDLLGGAP